MTNGKRLIGITGIDGSGKTTLLARLAASLPNSRTVTIWDLMKEPELDPKHSFRDKKEVDAYLRSLGHPERAEFLFGYLDQALGRALRGSDENLLIDAYWYKYFASELAMHGERARPDLRRFVAHFPKPDALFFIAFDAPSALRRKKTFSGYESGYDPARSPESFIAFQSKSYANLQTLMREAGAIVLDGESPVEAKVEICLRELARK